MSIWTILGLAIGGALFLEGVVWALFPGAARDAYRQLLESDETLLQRFGVISLVAGFAILLLFMAKA